MRRNLFTPRPDLISAFIGSSRNKILQVLFSYTYLARCVDNNIFVILLLIVERSTHRDRS